MRVLPVSSSTQTAVCFIQFLSSRSGKSSRACAPRLSLRLAAEWIVRLRLHDQVLELQRLHQVGVPDHRAVLDPDVAACRRTPCPCWRSPRRGVLLVRNTAQSFCMVFCMSSAQLRRAGAARWRGAAGRGGRSPSSPACGSCLCDSPGVIISATRLAAERPNTTRSSSELEPRRLAPCTPTRRPPRRSPSGRARRCRDRRPSPS